MTLRYQTIAVRSAAPHGVAPANGDHWIVALPMLLAPVAVWQQFEPIPDISGWILVSIASVSALAILWRTRAVKTLLCGHMLVPAWAR